METTSFIKTTAFGGYDKEDANRFIESLYVQIFDLKNQAAEKDSVIEGFKKDVSAEDTYKKIIEESRAKLNEANTWNQMLTAESEEIKADAKAKTEEIEKLRATVESQNKQIKDLNGKIESLTNGTAALSKVFIEAQKSADELVLDSQKQADALKSDTEKLVNNMIIEANNNAAKIVYEAEKKAAEIEAKSINDSEKMKTASDNMRAVMLSDISEISETMANIKELFRSLEDNGIQKIGKTEELLSKTENKLTNGGIPVFKEPSKVEPGTPDAPVLKKPDYNYKTGKSTNNEAKSALDEFARQAELLNGRNPDESDELNLEALAKQAAALGKGKKTDDSTSKSESIDLSRLEKQAAALSKNDDKNKNGGKGKKGGEIDLDALAKQAASLGK